MQIDTSLGKLWELVMDREGWHSAVHGGLKESDMTAQLNWTENRFLNINKCWNLLNDLFCLY